MKKLLNVFLYLILVLSFCTCNNDDDDDNPIVRPIAEEVRVIDTVKVDLVVKNYRNFLSKYSEMSDPEINEEVKKIKYDIVFTAISYKAKDPFGKEKTLSGLVAYPILPSSEKDKKLTILSDQHGTLGHESEALSKINLDGLERTINEGNVTDPFILSIAAHETGYVMIMPDYFGYGSDESSVHYYEHRPSLAAASRGMIEAIPSYAEKKSLKINYDKLFLTGYSEGGFATMATLKSFSEIRSDFKDFVTVAGAGGYDTEASMRDIIQRESGGSTEFSASYAWVILTYNKVYKINREINKLFNPEYVEEINKYVDNDLIILSEEGSLPAASAKLFHPDFIKGIIDNTDITFINALKDNNVSDFDAKGKVYLVHGDSDPWVPPFNTDLAYDRLRKRGVNVEKTVIEGGTHASTGLDFYFKIFSLL